MSIANDASRFDAFTLTPTPGPTTSSTTGIIVGRFVPANSISQIKATDTSGDSFTSTPLTDGTFEMTGVRPGTYSVRFTPNVGFSAPTDQTVTVSAGGRFDLGLIQVKFGSVTGSISPAGSVRQIQLINSAGQSNIFTLTSNSTFTFRSLVDDIYTIIFQPAMGYSAPPSRTFTIADGQDVNLGIININTGNASGLDFQVDNTNTTATSSTVTYTANRLTLSGTDGTKTVEFILQSNTPITTGSYPISGFSSGKYLLTSGSTTTTWVTGTGTFGAVIITAIDATNRKITGSFYFTARQATTGTNNTVAVNGTFNKLGYQ